MSEANIYIQYIIIFPIVHLKNHKSHPLFQMFTIQVCFATEYIFTKGIHFSLFSLSLANVSKYAHRIKMLLKHIF